jgi:hypothetical protein
MLRACLFDAGYTLIKINSPIGCYLTPQQNPPNLTTEQYITVNHPHHLLFSQQLKIIRVDKNKKVLVRHPDGSDIKLPFDYVDYASSNPDKGLTSVEIHLLVASR